MLVTYFGNSRHIFLTDESYHLLQVPCRLHDSTMENNPDPAGYFGDLFSSVFGSWPTGIYRYFL